ncbi:lysoplasmalogenase [Pipistrellus kuhlii]|uniref:Lysoplasmalogenase TMEM86B n=1 Tax=Pipistrellus kuhlii TaxID=59472 RepID=A0A7J7QZZ6_PIPKU|nr:lysoplasmalogenase [Pipistrellus kuhlii]KAF6269480.1 transmembrane protein 86B [Pipistrellus kuhlii]
MDVRKAGRPRGPHSSPHPHLASLSPFLLTCTAYFLLWIPEDPPSWLGALVKCLPVLSLVGLLRAHPGPGGSYSLRLQAALLFSALGDAFLIWPDLFLHGAMAFGAAQLLYTGTFGFSPLRPGLLVPIALASLPFSGLLLQHLPPALVLPLAAYALALSAMLWRGLARGGSARWGALLFAASDCLLSWHTFVRPLAHGRLLVMATYYAAQLLIALSAFQSPKLKTH